jgi:hypothetical protein
VTVTSKRAGAVRVGAPFRSLRRDGLVGALRQGCPLGGPDQRSAKL